MIIGLGEDVSAGMAYVATEVSAGRTGLWVGRGPAGFSVLAGATRVQEVPGGRLIGVSLTPAALRQLRDRLDALLRSESPKKVELDGIKLGELPQGSDLVDVLTGFKGPVKGS